MGTVADVNYGFKGEVTSAQTPLIFGIGSRYAVIGAGLKATAGGVGDRAVTVSPGIAWGDGVLSTWNTAGTVNAAANGTGQTRWDTLVIRRHWQPTSTPRGTSTLMLLTGGAQKAVAASRKTDRGVTDSDQPIALVPIAPGSAVAGTPVGLRCWSGAGGGLVAESVEALQYLNEQGTSVHVGGTSYTRVEDGSGALYWHDDSDPPWTAVASQNGFTNGSGWSALRVRFAGVGVEVSSGFLVRGAGNPGTIVAGIPFLVGLLPVGFRPSSQVVGTGVLSHGSVRSACLVYYMTNGRIEVVPFTSGTMGNFATSGAWTNFVALNSVAF